MRNGITLSKKHGLNPCIMKCFTCGDDYGIALPGRIKEKDKNGKIINGSDVKAPMYTYGGLCDKCTNAKKSGTFIIAVRDGESGRNPFRTGQMVCVKDEVFTKITGDAPPEEKITYMEKTEFMKIFKDALPKSEHL